MKISNLKLKIDWASIFKQAEVNNRQHCQQAQFRSK